MALSNEHGHLVLTTGNKSELATGFSTLYGDSAGGFAPIKDVPEDAGLGSWRAGATTSLARAARRRRSRGDHRQAAVGRARARPARRRPAADYEVLDRLLDDYVEHDLGRAGAARARLRRRR